LTTPWEQYQEDVAELFRTMGFAAEVEAELLGARARHRVDVVVRPTNAGIPVLWIVECKHWKARVGKEQVMTLAQIAQDVGADRAFLLSESGFQAGAIAASQHSNLSLSSLAELSESAKQHIAQFKLNALLAAKSTAEERLRGQLYDDEGVPPSIMAADMGELTDLLGACFDAGLAIDKALTGRFPARISGVLNNNDVFYDDAESLIVRIESELREIDVRTRELEQNAERTRPQIAARADAFVLEVRNLLELAGRAFAIPQSSREHEPSRLLCLSSMKAIGGLSEGLRDRLKGHLRKEHHAVMGSLIDGVYLLLAEPTVDSIRWDAIRRQTSIHVDHFVEALATVRR
jgi:hypothetical protein